MTDTSATSERTSVTKITAISVIAALFLAVAAYAIGRGTGPVNLKFGKNGIEIEVQNGDDLSQIIHKAVTSEDGLTRRTARSILRDQGFVQVSQLATDIQSRSLLEEQDYFHVRDTALPDRIGDEDFTDDGDLRRAFQELLWDRKGPFNERMLIGAPPDFLQAFVELREELKTGEEPIPLLEEMWERSVEWIAPFDNVKFRAEIETLPETDADGNAFFVCRGAQHIEGKYVRISVADPDDPTRPAPQTGSSERKARINDDIFPCEGGSSLRDMMQGKRVRIGLTPALARQILMPGNMSGPLPKKFEARFVVRPRYLVSESEVRSQ